MKNACHLILGPHLFTIHLISGPTAAFFHPMLVLLLGSGTAEISEPVPPWPAANNGDQNQRSFPARASLDRLERFQCAQFKFDFTMDEEGAHHPSTQDGLLAPVTFLHGNPVHFHVVFCDIHANMRGEKG